MARGEYLRWPTTTDIPLLLGIQEASGVGATGLEPEVAITRYRETDGQLLDGYYWDGSEFQSSPQWLSMSEYDATNNPGIYEYLFEQRLIGLEHTYLVYFRHTSIPVGSASEVHVVTNDIYIPEVG